MNEVNSACGKEFGEEQLISNGWVRYIDMLSGSMKPNEAHFSDIFLLRTSTEEAEKCSGTQS